MVRSDQVLDSFEDRADGISWQAGVSVNIAGSATALDRMTEWWSYPPPMWVVLPWGRQLRWKIQSSGVHMGTVET